MVTLEIDIIEGATLSDLANDLREIANSIDNGYRGGLTCFCGTSWGIDGEEEGEEEEEMEM